MTPALRCRVPGRLQDEPHRTKGYKKPRERGAKCRTVSGLGTFNVDGNVEFFSARPRTCVLPFPCTARYWKINCFTVPVPFLRTVMLTGQKYPRRMAPLKWRRACVSKIELFL